MRTFEKDRWLGYFFICYRICQKESIDQVAEGKWENQVDEKVFES